eukprot:539834_1
MIKIKSCEDVLQSTIDNSKDNESTFNVILKEMMNEQGLNYNLNSDKQKFLTYLYNNDNNNNNNTKGTNHIGEEQKYDIENNNNNTIELQQYNNNNKEKEREIFDGIILNEEQQ